MKKAIRWLRRKVKVKKTIKRLGRKIKENAFFIVVLVGLMLLPYIFTPKTAVIYYANSASEVTFRLNVPERQTLTSGATTQKVDMSS